MPGRGSLTKPFAHNAINDARKTSLQAHGIPAFTIHVEQLMTKGQVVMGRFKQVA